MEESESDYSVDDLIILDKEAQKMILSNDALKKFFYSNFCPGDVSIKLSKEFFDNFKDMFNTMYYLTDFKQKNPEIISNDFLIETIISCDNISNYDYIEQLSSMIFEFNFTYDQIDKIKNSISWSYIHYEKASEEFFDRFSDKIPWERDDVYIRKFSFDFIKKHINKLRIEKLLNKTVQFKIENIGCISKFLYSDEERKQIIEIYKQYKDLL
jgi:hypothetical protein